MTERDPARSLFRFVRVWQHRGIYCLIIRNPMGFLCAYVLVPEGHPWHGIEPDDLQPHGGWTFKGEYPVEQLPDRHDGIPQGWWLGWDYGHGWDAPDPDIYRARFGEDWPAFGGEAGHVWTLAEVETETTAVAAYVAGIRDATTLAIRSRPS